MPTQDQLARSKAIQRHTGRTFHVATRFLPTRVRESTYVLYAFFRIADDVVDDPDPEPPPVQRARLEEIRKAALGEPTDDPVLEAFQTMRRRHGIDPAEVHSFIDAMEMDIPAEGDHAPHVAFTTDQERTRYLRGSAVAVAHMMLAVMDPPRREAARPHAGALGEAFQLTNFLRDVREDTDEFDRVYLPEETLARTGAAIEDIRAHRPTRAFREAMEIELAHAEERYRMGVAGIRLLPRDCRFPVLLAAVMYAEYHRKIRARDYDVLTNPPTLSLGDYARLLLRTWWHWSRTGDPVAVFYRVSPVEVRGRKEDGRVARGSKSVIGSLNKRVSGWLP